MGTGVGGWGGRCGLLRVVAIAGSGRLEDLQVAVSLPISLGEGARLPLESIIYGRCENGESRTLLRWRRSRVRSCRKGLCVARK